MSGPPDAGVPPDSPQGLLQRALYATSTDRARALDRLWAIEALRALLDDQEAMGLIGARMAGATWTELGSTIRASAYHAWCRWGARIQRYETAGLLDDPAPLPPPVDPVDPDAGGPHDDRTCCHYCGHRIAQTGWGTRQVGWAHTATHGTAGEWIEVDCPGPEPWPTWVGTSPDRGPT